ncbi:MAG: choice-of-anchor Q domain-containing protein [Pirellulales bacterium]
MSYTRRLLSEPLEDRRMLSVVTVNNNLDLVNGNTSSIANLIASDGGDGISLREALDAANNTAGADVINFNGSLTGLSIDLVLGELLISDDVAIVGLGSGNLTVDAQGNSRVFDVTDGVGGTIKDVAISGLTVTGGVSNNADPTPVAGRGGGILSLEKLTLSDTVVTGNQTNVDGGGIWVRYGDLSLTGSTVSGNSALHKGGGIYTRQNALDVDSSTISGNTVESGGGIYVRGASTANITNSTIADNTAVSGGGLFLYSGSTTILSDVILSGNTATANAYDAGGGIWNSGNLSVLDSQLIGNMTTVGNGSGAGIWNNNVLSISRSTISRNSSAQDGGAIYSYYDGNVSITDSTISNNTAVNDGGAIFSFGTQVITGSTISANVGATIGFGFGGGIVAGSATIRHSTIVDNSTDGSGGGITSFGTITLDHTIVANNTATSSGPDISGSVTANWSLIEDTTNATIGGANNVTGLDPMLGPLADNGGQTQTHAILPGSPAIDAGDPTAVAGVGGVPSYDQRGTNYERVQAGRIDIGAYELLLADGNLDGQVDGLDYLLWASHYSDNPADDPPGSPQNGDYNNDGKVDGLDYLLWASQYNQGVSVVPAIQTASPQEQLSAVDASFANAYSEGATLQDWQVSQAFDAVLKHKDKKAK